MGTARGPRLKRFTVDLCGRELTGTFPSLCTKILDLAKQDDVPVRTLVQAVADHNGVELLAPTPAFLILALQRADKAPVAS